MSDHFRPDADIQKVASAYAEDAVEFSAKHFEQKLDFTDASIVQVEGILDFLHQQAQQHQPDEEKFGSFAKSYGSYVGEVYLRNHGATWGMARVAGDEHPGLQTADGRCQFWPWARVYKRIKNGESENVWHYYQRLAQEHDPDHAPSPSWAGVAPDKKPWWKRWAAK